MKSWKTVFRVLGGILIGIATINFFVFVIEQFNEPLKYLNEINEESIWIFLLNSTIPLILEGIILIFISSVISFLIDFYDKVCEIKTNTDKIVKNNNANYN